MNQHMQWPISRRYLNACAAFAVLAACCSGRALGGLQEVPPAATADAGAAQGSPRDRYVVKIAIDAAEGGQPAAAAGRVILFFVPDNERWAGVAPCDGPFFEKLQPIASRAVAGGSKDAVFELDDANATVFKGPLDQLGGKWRVQAVLDTDFTERGHLGPGNLVSEPASIDLSPQRFDEVRIDLVKRIGPSALPDDRSNLEWVSRRSELLSNHFHREVSIRAGVVLPFGYHDLGFPRRMWPTIYVIGDFGATHLEADDAAAALTAPEARGAIPQAVWVFLDPESAWGHHGFCDSESNGPVGKALVEEFVAFLEERFRLIRDPSARIVTGHSSGGWTSIHLALTYPETFGACFASAPDPVDFSAFQKTDLYRDATLFRTADGTETPSMRVPLGPSEDRVVMTVADEIASEQALDPNGRSGEQWAAWEAMWSPYDAARGAPRRLCDPLTGAIDPVTVDAWSRHDFARMLEADPQRIADLFATRIRLIVGSRDSFYLDGAVSRLKTRLESARERLRVAGVTPASGVGYIELLEGLTHETAYPAAQLRFHRGIVEHLRASGHGDEPPRPTALETKPARE